VASGNNTANPEGIMHDTGGGHTSGGDTSSFSSHSSHSAHTSAGVSAGQYYPSQNPNDQFYPVQDSNGQFYPVQNSNDLTSYSGARRRGPSPLVILLVLSIVLPIVFLVVGLSSFF
jgi:hypothetical protein